MSICLGKLLIKERGRIINTMRVMRISDNAGERFTASDAFNHDVYINSWADAMNFCITDGGSCLGNGDYFYDSRDNMRAELQNDEYVKNAPDYLFGDEANGTIEFVPDEEEY